jgi:aminopeptidase N
LGNYKKADYVSLFKSALNDSSYTVAGNALTALSKTDESAALTFAKQMSAKPAKGLLENAITGVIAKSGDETMFDKVLGDFNKLSLQSRFSAVNNLATYLAALKNTEKFKKGIDELTKFRDDIPDALKSQTDPYLNGMILKGILVSKSEALKIDDTNAGLTEQVNYVKSKLPEEEKKGF